MEKKLLVTGANGFMGSAITKLAVKKGFDVNVLVRKSSDLTNLKSISEKINFFYGDVRNIDSIKEAVKKSNIVFHVAADYRLWSKKPGEIYSTNVYGTENVALAVISENKKMIYTSSVATIGLNKNKISDENVKSELLSKSVFAVAKSGTVSLEICNLQIPSIILGSKKDIICKKIVFVDGYILNLDFQYEEDSKIEISEENLLLAKIDRSDHLGVPK